ncbi:transcriptional regulator, LuxR family [Thermodesulfobium narugense DSM 14796]|uniref:Transcriptional regulator, LuxR family n=1 Tax=Thermodesulfobium narugense DSM 14796 TaxID=747365 RepID=M1E770_9BACT|nr:transcriptional regulator, LuxR family [Thermodesulfobium narugense DSM 14796]
MSYLTRERFLLSFSLGLLFVFLWLFFLDGPFLYVVAERWHTSCAILFRAFLFVQALTFFVIVKLFENKNFIKIINPTIKIVSILFSVFLLGLFFGSYIFDNIFIPIFLIALCSIFFTFLFVLTLLMFFKENFVFWSVIFAISTLFATIVMFLLNKIFNNFSYLSFSSFPLLMFVLSKINFDSYFRKNFSKFDFGVFPKKIIFVFLGFYCCGGAVYNFLLNFSTNNDYFLSNIAYCISALVLPIFIYFKKLEISSLYRPSLAILIVAFFWFPLYFENPFSLIIFSLFQIGFAIFDFYSLALILSFSIQKRYDIRVLPFGYFIITSSIFFGDLLYFFIRQIPQNFELVSLLSYTAGIILILLFALIKADYYEPFLFFRKEKHVVTVEDSKFETIFEKKFNSFGLTPREKEIVKYILMGRNGRYIAEIMHISENTFKTHMRNIFRKCNVSNRQELIDIMRKD